MAYGLIYLVVNNVTKKCYVGQTRQRLKRRWEVHVQAARSGKTYAISNAIRKYGEGNFIPLEIDYAETLDELNHLEAFYIKFLKTLRPSGYNLDSGGRYYETHPETKIKIGLANQGRRPSAEARAKMSVAHKGNKYGLGSKSRTGYKNSEESKAKLSAYRKGKSTGPHTEEFKRLLTERNKGNRYAVGYRQSPEHVRKRIENGLRTRRLNVIPS